MILVFCLFLLSPVASAFSFSEFFSNLFGSEDSITGAAVGANCNVKFPCGKGETCSRGKCVASAVCGNSNVESGETCDDGNTATESCGDGTTQSGSYCNSGCSSSLSLTETCDGNSQSCTTDSGYSGTQSCNSGCSGWNSCSTTESCGDGTTNGNEACDDGNSVNTDSCKNDCTSPSVGDGVCSDSETCSTDSGACGECNLKTQVPTINFVLGSPAVANLLTVSTLGITDGTQCFVSITKESYTETQTRRGREGGAVMLTKERIGCSSAKDDVQSKLRTLSNGNYKITTSALNNMGQVYSVQDLKITDGAVTISDLEPSKFYSDIDVPKVSVSSVSATSCSYQVNNGDAVTFTCGDGLSNVDLSSISSQGPNTFKVMAVVAGTTLTYSAEYMYVSDVDFTGTIVESQFGGGGPGGGSSSVVVGDVTGGNMIDPSAGKSAISAILLNLRRHGAASLSERNEMLDLFKNNNVLKKEITSISEATGLSELSFGAVRTLALSEITATSGYTAKLQIYNSEKTADSWSSKSQKEKQFEFSKVVKGKEKIMRIKIR